jgi:thioredoxin 1
MLTSARLKSWANSWWALAIYMCCAYGAVRGLQHHWGQAAFAETGLPQRSLAEAQRLAQDQHKPIVAVLSATWCGACRAMDRHVFGQSEVKERLLNDFVYARIDETSDEAEPFAEKFQARAYPTVVLLSPRGEMLKPLPYTLDKQEFLAQLPAAQMQP